MCVTHDRNSYTNKIGGINSLMTQVDFPGSRTHFLSVPVN